MLEEARTTATILDEYCRYYSDFSKILGVYIKNFYPHVHLQFEQLLDASYNVWHRLSDEEKISLATFLEEISREDLSSSKIQTFNDLINSDFLVNKLKHPNAFTGNEHQALALNTNASIKPVTPFHIYLKDERPKLIRKHAKMPLRDVNRRLSERWQRMSNRRREKYVYRSYLVKKRLYKQQGKTIEWKKPAFIKRIPSKAI